MWQFVDSVGLKVPPLFTLMREYKIDVTVYMYI